ncbi:MAG TPA: serine/threonine-protein kinase [Myxococcaceae bacterium]|nr:serine/threonine-protein kinase [Myxococcaceae bacterium]
MRGRREVVEPGEVVQGYRVERKLGAGGFAQVYLARRAGRSVALKFIRLEDAEDWAKRELTILLHLRHRNVVKLVGHAEGPEQAPEYLVLIMEYVKGRTLYEWAQQENPSAREVARMVLELSRALGAVHAAGVLHRDFKGDNVLVRDEDGEPVLVDFGVSAVPWAPRVTREGLAPCTPAYRSPECVRYLVDVERPLDAPYPYTTADDLYALGVTLYVLLTDAYPSSGADKLDLMREIAREVPRAPHERNRRVPRALSELCMRMLEKEPQARFASAEALGEALEELLAEADASWDEPLSYGWDAAGRTTELVSALQDPADPLPAWARKNMKPRRGRKPAPPARGRLLWGGGVCGLLLAGLGGGYLLLAEGHRSGTEAPSAPRPAGSTLAALLRATFPEGGPTSEACFVREVAPLWKPPDAEAGAASPRAETPAPVVTVTTLRKEETLVKKREHKAPVAQKVKKGSASDLTLLCVGAATAAACTGAQVRPMPEPQECPSGAVDVMADRFGIDIGQEAGPIALPIFDPFAPGRRKPMPVQEGPVQVVIGFPWMDMPEMTSLSGRIVFGPERVYGRFSEARTPSGETFPVCFALVEEFDKKQGVWIRGAGGAGTVEVVPVVRVRAVHRFE